MTPKVLHLVEYLYQGGIERFLCEVARNISVSHLQQTFFAYEMHDFIGVASELKKAGSDIRIYKKKLGYDFKLLNRLNHIIDEENIDIIHTHDFGPMEYAVALKILHPKLTLIHTQHTLHHFVTNFKYVSFFQIASYFYENIIAVSEHVKETLVKKCFFMKGIPIIIHNGVDAGRYSELKNTHFLGPKLNLTSICRISKEKNLKHILRTCKKLKEYNIDFHLHHAGTGTQKEVESIMSYIECNQLSQNVTLHGHQDDVREILKLGDIFISSSFTEGHPIAVLEAMASYRLCLCSDIPAHQKISPQGILLFNLCDENDLFNKLLKIKEAKLNYTNQIAIAKNEIDVKYTIQQMTDHYLDLYTSHTHQLSLAR